MMKVLLGIISFVFICSSLNAQTQLIRNGENTHSMLNGIFMNKRLSAHLPQPTPQLQKSSPYSKVKQADAVKYQLDSILMVASGNDSDGKITCKYDSVGRLLQFYQYDYNKTSNAWEISYKYSYQYGDNYMIKNEYDCYSSTIYFSRTKTQYNAEGRILSIKKGGDSINFESTASPTYYLYDANNLLAEQQICNSSKTLYQKVQYFYDSYSRDTAEITYNVSGSILTPSSKEVYSYDSNGDRINFKSYRYSSGIWTLRSNSDFLYNTQRDCISDIESYYYNGTVDKSKCLSIYNTLIQNSDIYSGDTFTDNFPYTFQTQLNQMDLYQIVNTKDSLVGSYYFYYSPKVKTALSTPSQSVDTKLRYNTLTKSIEVSGVSGSNSPQLNIYSMNGTLLMSCAVNKNSIKAERLAKGIYIYKLIGSGNVSTGKFIVE
jgi:hypothetical protein